MLSTFGFLLTSCHHEKKSISFYYWKTNFHFDDEEKEAIKINNVQSLYVRYFDIDLSTSGTEPVPVSPVRFDSIKLSIEITPVIYIKNKVFEKLDTLGILMMVRQVYKLVSAINNTAQLNPREIQFDCDWTENSKEKYFFFIKQYRNLSKKNISATIRLHQVKYASRTGIPPVDYGVLMYYNMGEINAGNGSSIYEKNISDKYLSYLKSYPLPLDVALPIFSWAIQITDAKVVKLLSKMNVHDFENDTNFIRTAKNRFILKHACFHEGYYFKEDDVVKIEFVPENDLLDMIAQVNINCSDRIGKVIFYDLDKINLQQYDKNIYRKIAGHSY